MTETWKQYFLGSSCNTVTAGKRYFYHNRVRINHIDHLYIDLLSLANAQAAATPIGFSMGNCISGDRLLNLGSLKIEIVKKIFPATLEQGKPMDLYENNPLTIFSCHQKIPYPQIISTNQHLFIRYGYNDII